MGCSDPFQRIIEQAIRSAENVKGDFHTFVSGLRIMKAALDERVECAEDEMNERSREQARSSTHLL